MFNLAEFSSTIQNNGGIQKPSLFAVDVSMPLGLLSLASESGSSLNSTNLRFFCYATNLPGLQLATAQVRRYGYGPLEEKPFVPVFSSLQTRFICDGHGAIWNFFNAWIKYIVNFDARKGMNTATGFSSSGSRTAPDTFPYELNYKNDFVVDMTVTLYNPDGSQSLSLVLREAYPKFVGDVGLSWEDKVSFMSLPVEWSFVDWYNTILPGATQINFQQAASTLSAISSLNINKSTVQLSTTDMNTYIKNLQSIQNKTQ